MYLAVLIVLMGAAPLASVVLEALLAGGPPDLLFLVARWFVFWAVGVRLFVAGLKQIFDPAFTAEKIFGIADPSSHRLVTEIGFGNIAIGSLGLLTLLRSGWIVPAALCGALFLGLAGIKHALNAGRTGRETIAMVSDLAVAAIVGASAAGLLLRGAG